MISPRFLYRSISKKLQQSPFLQNLGITLGGNGLNIVLVIITTPIISRLFTPSTYGDFSIYLALSQNLTVLSTLQLPTGYTIPKRSKDFEDLVRLTTLYLLIFFTVSLLVFILLGGILNNYININPSNSFIIYFIPISILLGGFNYLLLGWNIRFQRFKRNSLSIFSSTLASKILVILYGIFIKNHPFGLVIGDIFQKLISFFIASGHKTIKKLFYLIRSTNLKKNWDLLKRYKNYPLYVLPSTWLTNLSNQIPIFLGFGSVFSIELGYYLMATSLIGYTISLVEKSLSTVSLHKLSEIFNFRKELTGDSISEIQNVLFLFSIIPILVIVIWGNWIFGFFLGKEWENVAIYAQLLIPLAFSSMMISFAFPIYRLTKKDYINFRINIISAIIKSIVIIIGLKFNFQTSILLYSISGFLINIVHVVIIYKLIHSKKYYIQLIKMIILISLVMMIILKNIDFL